MVYWRFERQKRELLSGCVIPDNNAITKDEGRLEMDSTLIL